MTPQIARRSVLLLALCLLVPAPARAFSSALFYRLAEGKRLYEAGRYAQVIKTFSSDFMGRLPPRDLSRAYYYLASSYEREGRLGDALSVYQLGVGLFPKNVELLEGLADLLHEAGLADRARPFYESVMRLSPSDPRAHRGLAEIDRSLGFLSRSREHYEKALAASKDQDGLWRDYAEVLFDLRLYPQAEAAVRKALVLAPDDKDELIDLALIERARGRTADALKTLDGLSRGRAGTPAVLRLRALWTLDEGSPEKAEAAAREALGPDPADPLALWTLAQALIKEGKINQARRELALAARGKDDARFVEQAAAAQLGRMEAPRQDP